MLSISLSGVLYFAMAIGSSMLQTLTYMLPPRDRVTNANGVMAGPMLAAGSCCEGAGVFTI